MKTIIERYIIEFILESDSVILKGRRIVQEGSSQKYSEWGHDLSENVIGQGGIPSLQLINHGSAISHAWELPRMELAKVSNKKGSIMEEA